MKSIIFTLFSFIFLVRAELPDYSDLIKEINLEGYIYSLSIQSYTKYSTEDNLIKISNNYVLDQKVIINNNNAYKIFSFEIENNNFNGTFDYTDFLFQTVWVTLYSSNYKEHPFSLENWNNLLNQIKPLYDKGILSYNSVSFTLLDLKKTPFSEIIERLDENPNFHLKEVQEKPDKRFNKYIYTYKDSLKVYIREIIEENPRYSPIEIKIES